MKFLIFFNFCCFLSEEMARMLQENFAFLSHVFTKIPVYFCKNLVCSPLLPPLYPSPNRAKNIPSPRAIFGYINFFEAFFPPLWKKSRPLGVGARKMMREFLQEKLKRTTADLTIKSTLQSCVRHPLDILAKDFF